MTKRMPTDGVLRVVLLTNSPAPYRTEFFNELARCCRLLITFDAKREPDRHWLLDESNFRFNWCVSRGLMIMRPRLSGRATNRRVLQVPLSTFATLERFLPDIVVSDELGVRTMWAALFCKVRRRPLIVWWEGTPHSDGTGRLRTLRRRLLLRCTSRVWGTGVESARSLARYGVPRERIDLGMTGIDTISWRAAVDHQRASVRDQVRAEHALQGAVLLFVGRLEPVKGVLEMLAALTALAEIPDVPPWSVLCVGAGPSGKDVDRWAAEHPNVPLARTGFVQPESLPKYYAAADIFVMPSLEDQWGIVCLEALVAGLPQITSWMAGAVADLVGSSDIGDIIDPRDAQAFAQCLAGRIRGAPTLVSSDSRTDAVTTWSPAAAATRGLGAIHACLEAEPSRPQLSVAPQFSDQCRGASDAVLTISVDDGHPSDRRAADLLADLGYAATFYVPARNSERPVMIARDIQAIVERFEVGAHTFNHVPLTQLDSEAACREITDGKAWLEDIASVSVGSFCYPRGKFTFELARLVQAAGFGGARTTMGNIVGRPSNPYISGATTQAFSHSRAIHLRHATLERNWLGILNYGRIFRFATDWTEHFERGVEYVAEHGGVAHLWFHSWEFDAYDQWNQVEAFLRRLKSMYCFRVATNGEVFANV